MSTLYHGSRKIIKRPTNDMIRYACGFGQGFYLTEDYNKAEEYAVSFRQDGYVSSYNIDLSKYNVLDLRDEKYSALNWVGIFAANRSIDATSIDALSAKRFLVENYAPMEKYDVVIGCRCDGIYTRVATDFINGKLSFRKLKRMLKVGEVQIAILRDEILDDLEFSEATFVLSDDVYPAKDASYAKKLDGYNKRLNAPVRDGDKFISDIMREGV